MAEKRIYSILRLRSQPIRPVPILASRMAPGAGIVTVVLPSDWLTNLSLSSSHPVISSAVNKRQMARYFKILLTEKY